MGTVGLICCMHSKASQWGQLQVAVVTLVVKSHGAQNLLSVPAIVGVGAVCPADTCLLYQLEGLIQSIRAERDARRERLAAR